MPLPWYEQRNVQITAVAAAFIFIAFAAGLVLGAWFVQDSEPVIVWKGEAERTHRIGTRQYTVLYDAIRYEYRGEVHELRDPSEQCFNAARVGSPLPPVCIDPASAYLDRLREAMADR